MEALVRGNGQVDQSDRRGTWRFAMMVDRPTSKGVKETQPDMDPCLFSGFESFPSLQS